MKKAIVSILVLAAIIMLGALRGTGLPAWSLALCMLLLAGAVVLVDNAGATK